ncbi:MAG: PilZ domain-containing protein [Deltaproteobacteria bacterium]|nr:PilZ domain-containing protein [Deltaproteobacteria bacterium]
MAQGWKEKRRYPRFRVNCPISFICFSKLRIGETSDISLGGMKIQCRYFLLPAETYDFTVVVRGRAISPRGRVVYLATQGEFGYEAGVCFVGISEEHQKHLASFLLSKGG